MDLISALALLVIAAPFLPPVVGSWERSDRHWLSALGRLLAPVVLFMAFEASLIGMGGIALMRFRIEGTFATVCKVGFLMLQPVGVVVAFRIAGQAKQN